MGHLLRGGAHQERVYEIQKIYCTPKKTGQCLIVSGSPSAVDDLCETCGDAGNEVTTEHSGDARELAANRLDKLFLRLWRVTLDFSSDVTPEVLDDAQIRTLWRPHILCQQLANAWTVVHPRYCLHRCVRSSSILLKNVAWSKRPATEGNKRRQHFGGVDARSDMHCLVAENNWG